MAADLETDYRRISFWLDTLGEPIEPRPPLGGDLDVDVAIVGAGYSGLWTAYYLARAGRALRVAVLEREVAGFGASGRNGGWCSALYPTSLSQIAREHGMPAATALRLALQQAVDEVGARAAEEGIDCQFEKAGTISLARSRAQLARAKAGLEEARKLGVGESDLCLLSADETSGRVHATAVLGALFTPHCATIQPARLARGLAEAVERRGVTIYERTAATAIRPGVVETDRGLVRAAVVVVATEGYGAGTPGFHRRLAPVYSLMVATEPLSEAMWDEVGLERRPTFTDLRHLIIYGQRTGDGRLAFGGRGAPYHFGSAVRPDFERNRQVHAALQRTLVELFPVLSGTRFSHTWGGALGVPRDWRPSVVFERDRGLATLGGYVGDGVAMSNLAGRTLAELICGEETDRTGLAFVGHHSRRWEPEPLRYLGVNAGLALMATADRAEQRTGRTSRRAELFARLIGG